MAIKKQTTISVKKNPEPLKGTTLKTAMARSSAKAKASKPGSEEVFYEVGDKANTKRKGKLAVAGGSYDKLAKMQSNLDAIKQSKKAAAKPVLKKKK